MSGLTTEMIQAAVYDEYGSMFIDVAKEFDTWMKETIERRSWDLPCPECNERDYYEPEEDWD